MLLVDGVFTLTEEFQSGTEGFFFWWTTLHHLTFELALATAPRCTASHRAVTRG